MRLISFAPAGFLAPVFLLAGCAGFTAAPGTVTSEIAALTGSVHGGQQPIAGALIALIAPGATGYGSAGTVLTSTTTDANGNFTLPRPYTCPSGNGLTYLLATGGNAGGGTNAAIAEAAVLGPCSSLTAATFISLSEVTTAAAAYVLAPFAATPASATAIGTSTGNALGLANAVGSAANLANSTTGRARITADLVGIVPPTTQLNTLADILAACINQGTAPSSTGTSTGACATLFTAATPTSGTAPTDTFQAALNIALHPSSNIPALYGLVTANAPYQPTLTAAPADFTLALGFNGGAITQGSGEIAVAIDASGNAWVTTGFYSSSVHSLTEISPAGVFLSGSTVSASSGFGNALLTNPVGLAIDQNGAVLVANNGGSDVLKFNPNGTLQATFTSANFSGPNGLAIDASGNSWIANFGGNKVVEILASGAEASTSPYTVQTGGVDLAINQKAVWETDYSNPGYVSRIDLTSHAVQNISTGGSNAGVALDTSNNVWVVTTGNGSIMKFSDAGAQLSPTNGYRADGSTHPQNIAIDGLGNAFAGTYLGNTAPGTVLEYSNTGTLLSPTTGFIASGLTPNLPLTPGGIAIDASGNVWLTGTDNQTAFPDYVTEIIGLAAPVVTPRSVATTNNTLGTRP